MMHQSPAAVFILPTDFALQSLSGQIGEGYTIAAMETEQSTEEYFDTFDWRLYEGGKLLARSKRRYQLFSSTGEELCQDKGPGKLHPRWQDFPVGTLQEELRAAADIRALCPQLRLLKDRQIFHLLNEDQKIVLKLRLDKMTVLQTGKEQACISSLNLFGIRGYSRPFQIVSQLVEQGGGRLEAEGRSFLAPVLDAAKIFPEKMAAKFAVDLEKDITAYNGMKEIGLTLCADLQMQLPGVISDIDTEFLHDFRIAMRRTRSLLSLYAKLLPAPQADYFRAEFKWLAQVTGKVRDCDVYLLQAEDFQGMLPGRLQPGLILFFQGLRDLRKKEFKLMKRRLKSPRATKLLKGWKAFLEGQLPNLPMPKGMAACRVFAAKLLKKRYKRIIQAGLGCGPESPDTTLHALRIEAKKLRYLLEFFRSLFAVAEVDLLVKHLKRLQNNLGEFNDLSVQQAMLGTFQSPRKAENLEQMLSVAAALGGLIAHLADRQQLIRSEFEETFQQFADTENETLVLTIIGEAMQGLPAQKDVSAL